MMDDVLTHSMTETSEAAKAGKTSKTARAEIYYALLARGSRGAIADELIAEGRNHGTVTGRLRDLEVFGLAERETGGERRSRYGHRQCVWRALTPPDAEARLSQQRAGGRGRATILRDAMTSATADLVSALDVDGVPEAASAKILRALETIASALTATSRK